MGLGQVRDLRRALVQAVVAERQRGVFVDLRDLMRRVPLQPKEVRHLIQCGALDGLAESRAALLTEAEDVGRAGSALQMAFDFGRPEVLPESSAQRLAWERHTLGQPVSVHPLELVEERLAEYLPLRRLEEFPGRQAVTAGVRLPGWTGGQGFYVGDRETFVVAKGGSSLKAPPPWQPLLLRGRWLSDEWGMSWLQVEEMAPV
jgi:DNA polymerase III alpha subunit